MFVSHFSGLRYSEQRHVTEISSDISWETELIGVHSDLFYANRKHLLEPETLREKSVSNLLNAIDDSRERPLARILVALGIRHVGGEVAELLAREFTTIDNLMAADEERLTCNRQR